ncbi:MAG: hypothetical protein JWO42_469, partial [Chloroflexi bacterium]|nr:hypothetical protein [Chloroflexota bacterium]
MPYPYMDRVATVGMAVVLIALAVVRIGGSLATQQTVSSVTATVAQNRALQQERLLINEEVLLLRKYFMQPSGETRRKFDEVNAQLVNQMANGVRATNQSHASADNAQLNSVALQARFVSASHNFFAAIDRGSRAQALAIDSYEIEPLIGKLTQSVALESGRKDQQLASDVGMLSTTQQTVRLISIVTFVPGVLLVIVFGLLFRGYRRQIASAARVEMTLLQHAALTDHLTGLGNHRAFAEEVSRAAASAHRDGDRIALALIDVDDFKQINDRHGHGHGDRVLAGLGAILRGGRASDRAFRLGGDEFALILTATREPMAAVALERIREAVETQLFGATVSVGIAMLEPGQPRDSGLLRDRADAALYEAKRRGRNNVISFDEVQATSGLVSVAKISAVRRLIAERQLTVEFQPIWSLERGAILGYEALARPDEVCGLNGPAEAFDIAEHIGRAPELDAVCREAVLARSGELPPGALLFLNLAPQSLDHPSIAGDMLAQSVAEAGLATSRVVLEITERSLAQPEMVCREARRLRDLGFLVALDDVGVGSVGLDTLRSVPVDFIKIDRGIVAGAL